LSAGIPLDGLLGLLVRERVELALLGLAAAGGGAGCGVAMLSDRLVGFPID
jgi:hypothetical protein